MSPDLQPGIQFEWTYTIPPRATVPQLYHDTAFCRDMPDVLATGYLVGLMELACINGLMPYVDWPREQSVGTMVNFTHLAASPPGMTLTIGGELTAVDGRRLMLKVESWDGLDKVCEGTHQRAIIAPDRFNAKLAEKKARAEAAAKI